MCIYIYIYIYIQINKLRTQLVCQQLKIKHEHFSLCVKMQKEKACNAFNAV